MLSVSTMQGGRRGGQNWNDSKESASERRKNERETEDRRGVRVVVCVLFSEYYFADAAADCND